MPATKGHRSTPNVPRGGRGGGRVGFARAGSGRSTLGARGLISRGREEDVDLVGVAASQRVGGGDRLGLGQGYRRARAPKRPLELYSFEISPFCRIAREALCELEIPYLLHNVGKKSPSRPDFEKRSGKMMVPYLVDQNTDTEMFESADIVAYLQETYAK